MSKLGITRRDFMATTAAGLAAGAAPSWAHAAPAQRPNIIYLCSDQQHWQAMGFVDRFFDTPAQDELARQSVVFEHAFCTTPQCSPSRSSMLTGFYPSTTGMMNNTGALGGTDLAMGTIGPKLQRAGYTTGFFGKWHLGNDPRGNAGWDEENKRGPDKQTTVRGVDFIKRHASDDKPFALFLMYLDPHDIYHYRPDAYEPGGRPDPLPISWHKEDFKNKPAPQKQFMTANQGTLLWGREKSDWEGYRWFYRDKVRLYDDEVAKVLAAVKDAGLWDNTIIVNTSDHGDMDTFHKLIFKGPFMYEHMMRIPMTVRVPAALGGGGHRLVSDYDWVNVDLTPTLLDFAGAPVPQCHGRSAKSLLTGNSGVQRREFVIGQYHGKQTWVNPIRTIRTHDFKFNIYIDHGEELYDLRNDPHELENRANDAKFSRTKAELRGELDKWIAAHDDPFYTLKTTTLDPREHRSIRAGRAREKG